MIVDLDEVERARAYLKSVNNCPLDKVVWVRGNRVISVPPHQIGEWRYIGLSNVEFAELQIIPHEKSK